MSTSHRQLVLAYYFPKDLRTEDVRCGVKMNVSAPLIFVSSISIMLHPTQAEGEFENFLTFSLIAFKSRFILSTMCILASICLGWHPKLCLIIGLSLLLVLLFNLFSFMFSSTYSYSPLFVKTDILKFQFDQESEFVSVCR